MNNLKNLTAVLLLGSIMMVSCKKDEAVINESSETSVANLEPSYYWWIAAIIAAVDVDIHAGQNEVGQDADGGDIVLECIGGGFCKLSVGGTVDDPDGSGSIGITEAGLVYVFMDQGGMDDATEAETFSNFRVNISESISLSDEICDALNLERGFVVEAGSKEYRVIDQQYVVRLN